MKPSNAISCALSLCLLAGCVDSTSQSPKVVEAPTPVENTTPVEIKRVNSIDGYIDVYARACFSTLSDLFEGAEEVFKSAGFTANADKLTDGRATVSIKRNQVRQNHGSCQMTLSVPQDDELLAGVARELNKRGLRSETSEGGIVGGAFILKKHKTLVSVGRNSRSGPTTITTVTGIRIR